MEYASVILVHYALTPERSELLRVSLKSLQESISDYPCELIVVDNGGNIEDSKFLLEETEAKRITHYIRNADNIFFGLARNQALGLSSGKYIAICDNDLIYKKGWLEACIRVLKETEGEKLLATPRNIIWSHSRYTDKRIINGREYTINALAGSNCWVMRRKDYEKIGDFENHIIAGTLWCRRYSSMGYGVIVLPEMMVEDWGGGHTKYHGYLKRNVEYSVKKRLSNGEMLSL